MKKSDKKIEIRSIQELRGVDDSGMFEGYITVWDHVDSYTSVFKRGAFKKTISERSDKVKVLYNHEELIGSSVSVREDEHGCFVQGRINLETQKGREVHALLRAGDLDGLSFGFISIKDSMLDGVRQIHEVKLFEYGPVDFPASDKADVTDVRAKQIIQICEGSCEDRDVDFTATMTAEELVSKEWSLLSALERTLSDIWFSDADSIDDRIALFDGALGEFHAQYLEWAREYITVLWEGSEVRQMPRRNKLAESFAEYRQDKTLEELASGSSFTVEELSDLARGKLIQARNKLGELPKEIGKQHNDLRNAAVETLCSELRAGLSPVEKRRIAALLGPVQDTAQSEPTIDEMVAKIASFRKSIVGENHA